MELTIKGGHSPLTRSDYNRFTWTMEEAHHALGEASPPASPKTADRHFMHVDHFSSSGLHTVLVCL